jgi:spoIIIJ-associated protein
MTNSVQAEGESTQEAIDAALEELGVGPEDVEIEVVEEANKGLLGLRKSRAKVIVTVKDQLAAVARRAVGELVEALGLDVAIDSRTEDGELWIVITGDSLAWLIGHHGRTLDSLQVIVGAIVSRRMKAPARVMVDVEGYRARRKQEIRELAERTVGKVLARQEAVSLRSMSAMERKIVHVTVGQYEGVASESEGYEPERYVVIFPAQEA